MKKKIALFFAVTIVAPCLHAARAQNAFITFNHPYRHALENVMAFHYTH